MDQPSGVRQAVVIIWVTLVICTLVALIDKWTGNLGTGAFAFMLIAYAFFCIVPYKISQGSNAARYFYVVFSVMSALFTLGGDVSIPKLDFLVTILLIPVEIFIIFRLFQGEASAWFTSSRRL
jgi:hypothetical protein